MTNAEAPAKPPRKRPSKLWLPLWWLNLAAAAALVAAHLGGHISPAKFWPVALLGVAYPYILLVNLAFLGFWWLVRRKRMLVSAVAVLTGIGHVGEHVQLFGRSKAPSDVENSFKVMSWNVRVFDLYNWSKNKHTRDSMLTVIEREMPDVLCIQEFIDTRDAKHYHMRPDTLLKQIGAKYHHAEYTQHARPAQYFGIATFSRFPIVDQGSVTFPDDPSNLCIWTDIRVNDDTVRVMNAHLASLRFGDVDYRFMKSLEEGSGRDSLSTAGPRIIGRMKNAFIRRATETEALARHIRKSPHPVLWCGDLNDTPMSYSYQLLRRSGLNDAFVESGRGLGITYVGNVPRFRIDHIMHGPALSAWDFRTLPEELSDHRAITAQVGFLP